MWLLSHAFQLSQDGPPAQVTHTRAVVAPHVPPSSGHRAGYAHHAWPRPRRSCRAGRGARPCPAPQRTTSQHRNTFIVVGRRTIAGRVVRMIRAASRASLGASQGGGKVSGSGCRSGAAGACSTPCSRQARACGAPSGPGSRMVVVCANASEVKTTGDDPCSQSL